MQFTCEQSVLLKALSHVSKFILSRATHPILTHFLINIDNDQISITGYDLSTGLRLTIDATDTIEGSFTVSCSLLLGIVSRLDSSELITIKAVTEDDKLQVCVSTKSSCFNLVGLAADEYPNLVNFSDDSDVQQVTLPVSIIAKSLELSLYSASSDDTKQVLCGLHFESAQDSDLLSVASTDGHRLTLTDFQCEQPTPNIYWNIPAIALSKLNALLKNCDDESLVIYYTPAFCSFKSANWEFNCRFLEGKYPAVKQLIPSQFSGHFTVTRKLLLDSLMRAAVFSQANKNSIVTLTVNEDQITIFSESTELGSSEQTIPFIEQHGDPIKFASNNQYLIESLKNLPFEDVTLYYNTPDQPFVIRPTAALFNTTSLLMPISVKHYDN